VEHGTVIYLTYRLVMLQSDHHGVIKFHFSCIK